MKARRIMRTYVVTNSHSNLFNKLELFILQAARPTIDLLESMDINYNVLGGGRIRRDDEKKTILVYGHSIGFPWDKETGFQHDVSVRLIKKAYPDYEVTYSNEGY